MDNARFVVKESAVAQFLERALAEALSHIADAAKAQQRGQREFNLVAAAVCEVAELLGFDQWNETQRVFNGLWRNSAWLRRKGATRRTKPITNELVSACVRELLQKGHEEENFKQLSRTAFNCIASDLLYDESADPCGSCRDCEI